MRMSMRATATSINRPRVNCDRLLFEEIPGADRVAREGRCTCVYVPTCAARNVKLGIDRRTRVS